METNAGDYRGTTAKEVTFRYVAEADGGRVVKGTIKASGEIAAQGMLAEQGLTPLTLDQAPDFFSLEAQLPSFFKVKPTDVINFSRMLATLLESGVTLLPSLQLLGQQDTMSRQFRRILGTVYQDLSIGKSFSSAISRHTTVFDEIYSRMIAVGEKTGRLETVLRELADHKERKDVFSKKVSGALRYPMMVMGVAMVVVFVLFTFALPPMMNMFDSMGTDLPLPTRILIALSNFLQAFKLYLGLLVLLSIPGGWWLVKRPEGRRLLDQMRMKAPVMGPSFHMTELAMFGRNMSLMLSAGLPLQEILELLPHTTSNVVMRDAIRVVQRGLMLGQGLTGPMSTIWVFPPLLLQMVRVGEESNTLETNLKVVADFYETSAEEKSAAALSMITPLSTVFIAAVAGFIAISIIMPIYSLSGGM